MNKVLLTGRLTRDPEMRSLASGKVVTTFTVASNEFIGGGREKAEYHPVVTWDRLAEIAGRTSARASRWPSRVASRPDHGTTTAASGTGRRKSSPRRSRCCPAGKKKDYEAQQAANSLVAQAEQFGEAPADRADPRGRRRARRIGEPTRTRTTRGDAEAA